MISITSPERCRSAARPHGAGRTRSGAVAVRHHDRLPLHPGPAHDRPVPAGGPHGGAPPAHTRRAVEGRHEVLRQDPAHQLRPGRGHRHRPGVPVRHELVGVLPLRRQRLRRPPGLRGPAGLLHGVHLPGPVDLRLGPPEPPAPQPVHVDGRPGHQRLGPVHPGRELLDAAPRGRRHRRADGARPARRRRRLPPGPGQPDPVDHRRARHLLGLPRRRRRRPGRVGVVDDQGRARRAGLRGPPAVAPPDPA